MPKLNYPTRTSCLGMLSKPNGNLSGEALNLRYGSTRRERPPIPTCRSIAGESR